MDLMDMDKCDFCGTTYNVENRRVVAVPRPSDPTDLCAIMWGCGQCEPSRELPTVADLERQLADGELPNILFLSV